MNYNTALALVTLCSWASSVAASSSCRCAPPAFLSIPRVNLSMPEGMRPCAPYKLLDARGTAEPQGVSLMFQLVIEKILANNTGAMSQSVVYPAGLDQNVTSGVQDLTNTINIGLEDCPKQKYFLFGYSQGATVVLNALERLDESSLAAVAAVVLIGNPFRTPGRLSNVNRTGQHDHRVAFGRFATQARQSNESIPLYSESLDQTGRIKDICLDNDIICAVNPECSCPIEADHLSYGMVQDIQDLIFEHVITHMF
ncbi:hypothetical protein QQS21_006335 [Conoideocrella luteorostrata]|uniref:Cutinase n=1 Tax=Conoideocrella luteorostrata TaxID=1105319 RepID=A0AAJ0CN58_9HYPO|nr:hypothetical protein QQS21_006335 [Conoideocrella luteorostrata]